MPEAIVIAGAELDVGIQSEPCIETTLSSIMYARRMAADIQQFGLSLLIAGKVINSPIEKLW